MSEQITATLSEKEWVRVRGLLRYAIADLDERGLDKTVAAKKELYDEIEKQTRPDDPETLAVALEHLNEELDIKTSFRAEEIGRTVAQLRD